jgi:hypothetical protein
MKRNSRSSIQESMLARRAASVAPAQGELLTEIADLLLSYGITPAQLHALMERAFVQAAARGARLKNGRINYSRVAAKTGLRRASVRVLLRTGSTTLLTPNPLQQLVQGWRTDVDFLDSAGKPRILTFGSKQDAFARLARRYARDIPKHALIQELLAADLATSRGNALRLHRSKSGKNLLASKAFRASVLTFLGYIRQSRRRVAL